MSSLQGIEGALARFLSLRGLLNLAPSNLESRSHRMGSLGAVGTVIEFEFGERSSGHSRQHGCLCQGQLGGHVRVGSMLASCMHWASSLSTFPFGAVDA